MQNNQKQEEKTQSQKEIKDQKIEYQVSNFYFLLLIQILVIFISPFILDDQMFFRIIILNRHSTTTFNDYCNLSNRCRYQQQPADNKNNNNLYAYNPNIEKEERQLFLEWKESFNEEKLILSENSYYYLILYPLIMILQSIFKNFYILRKCQKILYFIQLQLLCFFVRILAPIMQRQLSTQMNQYIMNFFCFLLINIIILLINQQYFKVNLNLNNVTQPLMIIYFVVTFIQLFTNYFEVSNFEWAALVGIMILIHLYLIKLNTYLFDENNKFIKQNKSLIAIVLRKINPIVDSEDALKELEEKYFILSKKKTYGVIFGFILLIYFRDQIFQYAVILNLGIMLILLIWDTSLISTCSKLTMKDSCLAANLFFLDLFMPFRNIVQYLIV